MKAIDIRNKYLNFFDRFKIIFKLILNLFLYAEKIPKYIINI